MSQPADTWRAVKREAREAEWSEKRVAREALLIQFVAEVDRGLSIIDAQLRRGDFMAARETAAMMRLATVAVDGSAR